MVLKVQLVSFMASFQYHYVIILQKNSLVAFHLLAEIKKVKSKSYIDINKNTFLLKSWSN